jgi:8-oxo-dGTP pyrophosphatase MutT (NUDIX family)
VLAGETSAQGAQRELFEELGLSIDFPDRRAAFTTNESAAFRDWYLLSAPHGLQPEDLKLDPVEVAEVTWATRDEVQALLGAGQFVGYLPGLIDFCFATFTKDSH